MPIQAVRRNKVSRLILWQVCWSKARLNQVGSKVPSTPKITEIACVVKLCSVIQNLAEVDSKFTVPRVFLKICNRNTPISTDMNSFNNTIRIEVITGVQRRRRWTANQNLSW
jgi:hypothetical protein